MNPPTQKEADECQSFMDDAVVLDLSNAVVEKTIEIRKTVRIKLPDAIIAATALVHTSPFLLEMFPIFQMCQE